MNSKVTIASSALILLGADTIASFDEDTTESKIVSHLYENILLSCLTETRWRFATKFQNLAQLTTPTTINNAEDYKYIYILPTDFQELISINDTITDYEIRERNIHCNYSKVKLKYIYRPQEQNFPAYFVKYLAYALAAEISIPITEDDKKLQIFTNLANESLRKAKYIDASSNPNRDIISSPYVQVRS